MTYLKLPRIEPAMCWQAQIDAVVMDEVLRGPWFWASLEVGRSGDYGHADVRPHPHAGVIALGDDVGQAALGNDLDFDLRVLAQKRLKFRP
jgi:hypothetical protein